LPAETGGGVMQINSAEELKNINQIVVKETNGSQKIKSDILLFTQNFSEEYDLLKLPMSPYSILISEKLTHQFVNNDITGIKLKEKDWFTNQS
jgi:hypothetical protein